MSLQTASGWHTVHNLLSISTEIVSFFRRHRKLALLETLLVVLTLVLSLTGRGDLAKDILVQIAFLHGLLWALVGMSGVVSDDVQTGTIAFYLQKTSTLRRFYLRLFWHRIVSLLVAAACLGAAMLLLFALGSITWAEFRRYCLLSLLLSVYNACVVYTMSAAAFRRDSVMAIAYLISTAVVAVRIAADRGPAAATFRVLLFPVDALVEVIGAGGHREGDLPGSLLLLVQVCFWVALAYAITDRCISRSVRMAQSDTR